MNDELGRLRAGIVAAIEALQDGAADYALDLLLVRAVTALLPIVGHA